VKVKLLVPRADRCSIEDRRGVQCARKIAIEAKRVDGTTFKVCMTCANKLREQIEAHPDKLNPLLFTVLK